MSQQEKQLLDKIGTEKTEYQYEITARMSKYILYFKGGVVLLIGILPLLFLYISNFFNIYSFLIVLFVTAIFLIKVILDWSLEFYVISPDEILHRKGIFFIRKEIILLKNIEIIRLYENLVGHFLNFGTIELYAPTISQTFLMKNIGKPSQYIQALERIIKKHNNSIQFIRKN